MKKKSDDLLRFTVVPFHPFTYTDGKHGLLKVEISISFHGLFEHLKAWFNVSFMLNLCNDNQRKDSTMPTLVS